MFLRRPIPHPVTTTLYQLTYNGALSRGRPNRTADDDVQLRISAAKKAKPLTVGPVTAARYGSAVIDCLGRCSQLLHGWHGKENRNFVIVAALQNV